MKYLQTKKKLYFKEIIKVKEKIWKKKKWFKIKTSVKQTDKRILLINITNNYERSKEEFA